jgi:hypothetical protein
LVLIHRMDSVIVELILAGIPDSGAVS